MAGMDSLSERMAEVARQLQDHQSDPEATFDLATKLVHSNVDGCDSAGLSFVHARQRVDTVAATDHMAFDADQLQYELGEGPCLDSIWEEEMVHSPDLAHDQRWPNWGPRVVQETEAESILCFRLFTHQDTMGALNLYSRTRDAFDRDAQDEGRAIAAHVAIAVAASQEVQHLSKGLHSHTIIGQATGILMERFDLDATVAFSVLVRLSQDNNVKLHEVAAETVATRASYESPPG
jgi:transcriptional regulator with GAF, ATPase, and Fis domain